MNRVDLEELVVGVKKANLSELKELKVKLPVRLLVNLHYVKLTQSRGISEVVNEALTQYFASFGTVRSKPALGPLEAAAQLEAARPALASPTLAVPS